MTPEPPCVCTKPFIQGRCHTCGVIIRDKTLDSRRTSYCSDTCQKTYWVNHYWGDARAECLRRTGGRCAVCGGPAPLEGSLPGEAHHIIPLNGLSRHDSCLNHQTNLQALCHKCHALTRKKKETLWRETATLERQKAQLRLEGL